MAMELQGEACLAEEEERFHGLHPLKRFKILEKEKVLQKKEDNVNLHRENEVGVKVCSLPAKKRVCALQFFTGLPDEDDEQENRHLLTQIKKGVTSSLAAGRALKPITSNHQVLGTFKPNESEKEEKKTKQASSVVTRTKLVPTSNRQALVPTDSTKGASPMEQQKNGAESAKRKVSVTKGGGLNGDRRQNALKLLRKRSHRQPSISTASSSRIGEKEMEGKLVRSKKEAGLPLAKRQVSKAKGEGKSTCGWHLSTVEEVNCESVSVISQPSHDHQVLIATWQSERAADEKPEETCSAFDAGEEKSDSEDDGVFCDVCKGVDAEPSDPIVFCDGCNVMVHPSCYGSPLNDGIPDGDWFCRQCESENRRKKAGDGCLKRSHVGFHAGQRTWTSRVCCLCPSREGAMKQTTTGAWAHLSCALYVPEVFYKQARDREGIECSSVPAWRWDLPCIVCATRGQGSCIQCTEVGCTSTFHVSCALNAGLTIDFRNANALTKTPAIVIAFCPSHARQSLTSSERRRFKIVPRG